MNICYDGIIKQKVMSLTEKCASDMFNFAMLQGGQFSVSALKEYLMDIVGYKKNTFYNALHMLERKNQISLLGGETYIIL